jgi:ABC-type dipeptide/oligopeptide/nickel transport system permease subunit
MTDTSDLSPRQQRLREVSGAETGMHTLPGVAPPAAFDDGDQFGMDGEGRGQLATTARRFIREPLAITGLAIFASLALAALLAGWFWTYSYTDITNTLNAPPSLSHPFGTNTIGGDVFAQVMHGTLLDIQIALLVAVIATVIGAAVGAVSGYYGGLTDTLLMRFVDLILVIPVLAILIVLAHIVAKQASNWFWLAVIIGFVSWTYVARLVRADFLSLREREFIEASRALGATNRRIILRHMLPNAAGPIIVNATITVALSIVLESTLSYIGLGIQAPNVSLGLLVSQGQDSATTEWWLFVFPVVFLVILILSIFFIGDGLREALDPKKNRVRA